ncbi:GDSL-type esterase/lipase family protein [Curtobacterium flaccumfaciens]|uniref:GDSL-type esterase/lipase family protein n=1 Tax=Curtobacterium flaccumfaciens TaxID=2035 RepID=UPI000DA83EEA|nr:GDSL-type esterase/lipase family protein [Curtobacterium flaccumfaciens]PZF44618.1 hypothetical protein DEJ07_00675 [Curtobacterium sp. MCLR17_053]PZF52699.1 hypothetical protein DEJ06_05985 [Curtobacterium sp. MCLR17_051]MBO9046068.1 hypothetical protein [Curtobacterium flaccumfaciens pv. flaccumfaciens]MCS5495415.1 hypothetical protein [Curtobacterium flaccumfaciens pv. flaccumfaciens]QVG66097.1 hypothetical protein JG551_003579 [Curtobacterium flaccumfaciens pv. flaccumfaciens]
MWARLILSVAVRAYFARTRASYMRLPRPDGVKFVRADGPEPVSVLILGTDAASGWGVRSHELGLPGFFARALRQRLGRGVTVELAETPAGVVSDLVRLAAARSQWEVDAVLIVGGIADAAQLRDARQWRSGLEDIVRISRCSPSCPKAFIVGMPQPSVLPGFRSRPNGLIDRQADTLNRESADFCAQTRHATYIPPRTGRDRDDDRLRSSNDYRLLGTHVAEAVAFSFE